MLIKRNLAVPFYVQDERYNVVAWMPLNVYVQDERYNVVAWIPLNVYVQAFLRHPGFQDISVSMHVDERY
jgi:hypothetical protein